MTTTSKILIALAVVVVLGGGAIFYMNQPAATPAPAPATPAPVPAEPAPAAPAPAPTSTPTPPPTPAPVPGPTAYTMAQVALHASASDCWTVIRGSVYNLTTWIGQHPGGQQAILQLCGKDGTAAFTGQHGGSAPQENKLATFKIGVLAP